MRYMLVALSLLLGTTIPACAWTPSAAASSSVSISIGIHHADYPELVLVPGYPVYYAPRLAANYFFHDGYYWLYHEDRWYMSDWFDGPWTTVDPDEVPLFVLRVPVRYYLSPPPHFHGWHVDAAPRWHLWWGPRWTRYGPGWDQWDRRIVHAPAPLPLYQRHYSGDRYPRGEYRHVIHREHYRYRPHDTMPRERAHRRHEGPRPQMHAPPAAQMPASPDLPRTPQSPQRWGGPDWSRTPSMPAQPQAVSPLPAAVPPLPAAVPASPGGSAAPQSRVEAQPPRERGEFRGHGAQRDGHRLPGAAPPGAPAPSQQMPRAQHAPTPQSGQHGPRMRGEGQHRGDRGPGRG